MNLISTQLDGSKIHIFGAAVKFGVAAGLNLTTAAEFHVDDDGDRLGS